MSIMFVLLLGIAVSLDSFAAGLAYGLKGIALPRRSLAIVGLVTALCTALAMFLANLLGAAVNTHIAVAAGALLLIGLGLFSLFQEYLATAISPYEPAGRLSVRQLTFSIGRLVVTIMIRPETADLDQSLSISPAEAGLLGLALGVDNMVAAFGAALIGTLPWYTPLAMGLIQISFIAAGCWASSRVLTAGLKRHFPYLPGTLLILLGLLRLR
ncbi:MAG TPA: manganese efflux pump [Selenomonadales bacterium]|nr:manganese efflux pump [Selenomonadales bacterium]